MTTQEKHTVTPENAPKFLDWLANRGGVAIWESINFANLGASWSTPAQNLDGSPAQKPTWQAANQPARIITSADDVVVETAKEVKRFRVAVRFGGNGMSLKVTDAGSARIRREVAKAALEAERRNGGTAWHVFDYATQEAVILVTDTQVPLTEWKQS